MTGSVFTKHGFDRVKDRMLMPPREVLEIIDTDEVITLGIEEGTNRIHKLFYSEADDDCFVVVQDQNTREIITILYSSSHTWRISEHSIAMARYVRGFGPRPIEVDEKPKTIKLEDGTVVTRKIKKIKKKKNKDLPKIRFGCVFQGVDEKGFPINSFRTVYLAKVKMSHMDYMRNLKDKFESFFKSSPEVLESIKSGFLLAKKIKTSNNEVLDSFFVKSSQKGTRILLDEDILLS